MTRTPFSRLMWLALFGLALAACGGGADTTESAAASSEGLFGGEYTDVDGQPVQLAEFEGQDVVLWFWAPW